jgi:hypothetical protein
MYPNNTVAFMKSFYESNHGRDVQRSIEVCLLNDGEVWYLYVYICCAILNLVRIVSCSSV